MSSPSHDLAPIPGGVASAPAGASGDRTVSHRPPAPDRTPTPARRRRGGWFRAVWRWHFYAAFLVVPILLMLAVTGLIYLFRFQLEPLLHAELMKVQASQDALPQPYAAQQIAVENAFPDATIVSLAEPRELGRSTVFSVVEADGDARDVYVDPYTREVLGALDPDSTLSGIAVRLHGELMAPPYGDWLIELAACWAVVMALTGYYLFVKGRRARRRRRTAKVPGARLRSRHALVGSVTGLGLLFLLVSGLPWTGFWGGQVQQLATDQGSSLWSTDPGALSDPTSRLDESLPHSHAHEVPWAMGASDVPEGSEADEEVSVANLDTAVAVADAEGLRHPMTVAVPAEDAGVFSVIGYAFDAPSDERTVHVDRFSGEVVSTYGYDDYPALAKAVSQGIGLHEGRSLGLVSFWGAAVLCLGVLTMCLTGPVMWWRRRPSRAVGGPATVGAPRGRLPVRATPPLAAGLIVLGVLLPFFGLSVLVVLLLDQLLLRRVPRLAEWFGAS